MSYELCNPSLLNKNVDLYVNSIKTIVSPQITASPTVVTTAISATNVVNGIVRLSASGNVSLPTAALLVAAFPNVQVGGCISFLCVNETGGSCALTTATGLTLAVAKPIATLTSKVVYIYFTNITASSEAAQVY